MNHYKTRIAHMFEPKDKNDGGWFLVAKQNDVLELYAKSQWELGSYGHHGRLQSEFGIREIELIARGAIYCFKTMK